MKNKLSNNQGFTLIETFVAITILLIAVLGPLTVLSKSIVTSTFAKNEVTAYYLAQSAIEDAINYQKSYLADCSGANPLSTCPAVDWLGDLSICEDDEGCNINTHATSFVITIIPCNLNQCTFTKRTSRYGEGDEYDDGVYSSLSNLYPLSNLSNYVKDETSREFYRSLKVEHDINNPDRAKISVSVTWNNGFLGDRNFVLSTYIFNYKTE